MARKRKKKLRRKKEERRETGEREKRKCFFNERKEKSVIKKIYIYILTSSYNTQQKIAAYCSSKVKIFSHAFIIVEQFFFILVKLK